MSWALHCSEFQDVFGFLLFGLVIYTASLAGIDMSAQYQRMKDELHMNCPPLIDL